MKSLLLRLALVLGLIFGMVGTVSAQSLQHSWEFDGSPPATDSEGNVDLSCSSVTSGVSGQFGTAYSYDSSSSSYCETDSSIWDGSSDVTISMWVKMASSQPNADFGIFAEVRDGSKHLDWNSDGGSNSNTLRMFIDDGSDTKIVEGSTNIRDNNWHHIVYQRDGDTHRIYVDGSEEGSVTDSSIGSLGSQDFEIMGKIGNAEDRYIDGDTDATKIYDYVLSTSEVNNLYTCNDVTCNSPPQFDSVSTSPSSWTLGSSINVSADVSDSDGTVSSVSADVYEDGTQIVDSQPLSEQSGTTWNYNDLFEVDESDVYYNVTLTAEDDQGAVTYAEINRFLSDTAPVVSLQEPGNSTYWSYSVPLEFSVDGTGDSLPGETLFCEVYKDGSLDRNVTGLSEQDSYTDTVRSDLGQHMVKVSCSDETGNEENVTEHYTVEDFEIQGSSSPSTVFETEYTDYSIDYRSGDMVNNVESTLELTWNGSNTFETWTPNTDATGTVFLYNRPPIVPSNQSSYNWNLTASYNATKFNGGTEVRSETSSTNTQTVEHGYFLENQSLDRSNYAAGDDIRYTAYLRNKTDQFNLDTSEISFTQTGNVEDLGLERTGSETVRVSGVLESQSINQSSVSETVDPGYQVSFESDSRGLDASNIGVTLEQVRLEECSGSNGPTALQFTTYKESSRDTEVESRVDAAMEYWNVDNPDQKKVLNSSTLGKTHSFCLTPGYASIKADSTDKLIQYSDEGDDYVLRSYFLINQTLDNQTTNIPLYMLNKTDSSRVRFTVENENRNPVSNAIIKVSRYFPEVDNEVPVAMVKTGAEGQTETFLEVNEIYYSFNIYRDGDLRKQIPQQVIPSDLELLFTLGSDLQDNYFDYEKQVGGSCQYNGTQVTCEYDSQTESLDTVSLSVYEEQSIGKKLYERKNLSTSTGTMTVEGFNASETQLSYDLTAYFNNDVEIVLDTGGIGDQATPFRQAGLFLVLLQFLVMALAGLWKPTASITLGVFSLIISASLPFMAVPQTALTALVALGAVLIWRMN